MFSSSVEVVLTIAYREAVSRRHAYVTLEHLLYALAHDVEGERILEACGVDLPKLRRDLDTYLNESIEQFPRRGLGGPVPVPVGTFGRGCRRHQRLCQCGGRRCRNAAAPSA